MQFWRAHIVRLAALTLTLQVGVIASASAAVCCGPQHPTAAEMDCCKESGGAPHVCHLKKAPRPDVPVLKACCTPDQHALAALFGFAGIPELRYVTLPTPAAAIARSSVVEQPVALLIPPDSPPPRA